MREYSNENETIQIAREERIAFFSNVEIYWQRMRTPQKTTKKSLVFLVS